MQTHCYPGLAEQQAAAAKTYRGKVRDLLVGNESIFMVHSDRLSAFDRAVGMVPYKGLILAAISEFWFGKVKDTLPNHFLARPHPRVIEARRLTPLKVEVVVRGHLAGSMLRAYEKGERVFCGESLPEGLHPYQELPAPIITPTSKAGVYEHDEDTTPSELIATGVVDRRQWAELAEMALALFSLGRKEFALHGWTLADTKYEFGADASGKIWLIDEIHTPDSSRLWQRTTGTRLDTVAMFDKEIIRRYLLEQGFSGHGEVPPVPPRLFVELAMRYLAVAESLTRAPLMVDDRTNNVTSALLLP